MVRHLVLLVVSLFVSTQLNAFTGASTAAVGDTGAGAADANEYADLNPATLAIVKGYLARAGYSQNQNQHQVFGLTLADNEKDTVVPGGLSYTGVSVKEYKEQALKLTFGNFVAKNFSAGVGLHYAEEKLNEETHRQFNGVAGALYNFNSKASVGLVVDDFVQNSQQSFNGQDWLAPRATLGGSLLVANAVRLRADVGSADNFTFGRPILGFGGEGKFSRYLIGRAGYLIDNDQAIQGWTAGLGLAGKQVGFHYAYQNLTSENAHFFDLSVPL